jgi:hypothetical protein
MKTENIHIKTFSNKRRTHKASADDGLSLFDAPAGCHEEAMGHPVKKSELSSDQLGTLLEATELKAAICPAKK